MKNKLINTILSGFFLFIILGAQAQTPIATEKKEGSISRHNTHNRHGDNYRHGKKHLFHVRIFHHHKTHGSHNGRNQDGTNPLE
jgi:hypothetical protein